MAGNGDAATPVRVVLAEDSYLVREGITLLIAASTDIELEEGFAGHGDVRPRG